MEPSLNLPTAALEPRRASESPAAEYSLIEPLAHCLTAGWPEIFPILQSKIKFALAASGRPFEVVAGTPASRYGARLTFRPAADPLRLATAFDLERHPWGTPSWIGIRVSPAGVVHAKPYHRLTRLDGRFVLPAGLRGDLYPVMASLDGDAAEVYFRSSSTCSWESFTAAALASFGGGDFRFAPRPRAVARGFGISFRRTRGRLSAATLYAFSRALPDEQAIHRQWIEGMDETDARAYEMALIGVRSVGRLRRGTWHAILAWTLEENGIWHRAVSLRVPM
jgi:hypothetical protein